MSGKEPRGLAQSDWVTHESGHSSCTRFNIRADGTVNDGVSVVGAVAAEGLHGGRTGACPLRHGPAGRAPGGDTAGVRAPVPACLMAFGRVSLPDITDHGPALGIVLPRLATAVGRPVEHAEGPVGRFHSTARRGVGETPGSASWPCTIRTAWPTPSPRPCGSGWTTSEQDRITRNSGTGSERKNLYIAMTESFGARDD